MHRLSAPLSPSHRSRLVDALSTWNFKPHELDEGDLFRLAVLLFEAVLNIEGVAELGIKSGELYSISSLIVWHLCEMG